MPDFVVIGAAKAGTSTLHAALSSHPDVFLPSVPEPGWFAWDGAAPRRWPTDVPADVPVRDEPSYQALYADAPAGALTGEVCPLYLESAIAPDRLKAAHPDARIVVTVRDPVSRAWSSYWMHVRGGLETRPPEDAFGPEEHRVQVGHYAANLAPWVERFDRVCVLQFEEWTRDGLGTLAAFLDLTELPMPPPENVGGRPRNPLVAAAMASPSVRSIATRLPDGLKKAARRGALAPIPPIPPSIRAHLESIYAADVDPASLVPYSAP
jgi:hypothetical protein